MEIAFIGGARRVTGSLHMLTVGGARVLLDCGLNEGRREEARRLNLEMAQLGREADALILTHAHMDHAGNVPTLVRAGFGGHIWATAATRDLCAAMLRDSAHLQEADAAYLNKKKRKAGQPLIEPLYTQADAEASMRHFVGVAYHRAFAVAPGVEFSFLDAGHILGSALIRLSLSEDGRRVTLGYTGDLGREKLPIVRDPELLPGVDYLILESTYGSRDNESPEEARLRLEQVVNETYRRGGKLIVPAFAVGRTQELVYDLYVLREERRIPKLPIFVDSPLAVDVTEIFRLHPECYDEQMRSLLERDGYGPLGHNHVRYVRSVEDSKELNFLREPAIIISASGMAEGGRILHHLKHNIGDERNTILFVGYQAQHTLGRRILDGAQAVRIFDEEYPVRARVESIAGYSAHADRTGLLSYAEAVARSGNLQGIFLVHGEEEAITALAEGLRERGLGPVMVPAPGERVPL